MAEVLGPDDKREISRLRRALTLGRGSEFHVVIGDTRRVVDAALAELLPGVEVPQETVAPEEPPLSFARRWMKWLQRALQQGGETPVVLDAWDIAPDHVEHWGWIFARLNERRNEIVRALDRPLVLLVSPNNERLLGRMGPDLWSIRGVGMRLRDRGRITVDRVSRAPTRAPLPKPPDQDRLERQERRLENALAGTDVLTQAIESIRMARQLYESQRGADALQSAQQAIVRYEILASDDETTRIDLARALQTHAEIAAGGGHRYAAIDGLQRAASIIDEQLAKEPTRVDYVQELMTIQSSLGDLYRATRQEQEAQRADEIVATIEKRLAETKTYRPIPSGGTNAASIFISYSHESSFHAERVRALADRLCREGLDVRLDQHLAHPKEGWPVWIERQIATADFVLLICTSTYRHRFEGTQALEPTPGTSFETRTAEQLLYESSTRNHGLIPMIPDDGTPDHIPTALRAFTYYRMSADFDVLRQRIVNNR